MPHETNVLRLFRRILTLHKTKLPQEMRKLGDAYVREEFKRHANVKDEKTLQMFVTEWNNYATHTENVKFEEIGKSMSAEEKSLLDSQQQEKLEELEASIIASRKEGSDK